MSSWAGEVSRSIYEGKWLNVKYQNLQGDTTYFWCAIKDIEADSKKLTVDVFNSEKSDEIGIDYTIYFDRILRASVVEGTTYPIQELLIEKIKLNYEAFKYLEFQKINDRILNYYLDCYALDNEPFQQEFALVPGIDVHTIDASEVELSDESFDEVISILKNSLKIKDAKSGVKYERLIMNYLSIESKTKGLIPIVYYDITLDLANRKIVRGKTFSFSTRSITISDTKDVYISSYIDCDYAYFKEHFTEQESEFIEQIEDNLSAGERLNQMPFFIKVRSYLGISLRDEYFEISKRYEEGTLNEPLKAFFGLAEKERGRPRSQPIVVANKNTNVNQLRVIYNAVNRNILYVQGPPGTGKTVSIVNIVHSCLLNDKKALITSNNNEAIDNIVRKISSLTYNGIEIRYPYLRWGSNDTIKQSLKSMMSYYEYFKALSKKSEFSQKYKESREKIISNMSEIVSLIKRFEEQDEIQNQIESLKNLVQTMKDDVEIDESTRSFSIIGFESQIQELYSKLEYPLVKNQDLTNLNIDEEDVSEFLYLSSIMYGMGILDKKNSDLRDILEISEDVSFEQKFEAFRSLLSTDAGMEQILDVYPVIFCTNISTTKIGEKNTVFDLLIMEEASQCNPAISLVPMSRCKQACFIGDQNQLQPVVIIPQDKNDKLRDTYSIPDMYSYVGQSILTTLLNVDAVSKFILLKKHYRCAKKIIDFSNQKYYGSELEIETDFSNENALKLVNVVDSFGGHKNTSITEMQVVLNEIEQTKDTTDIAVITPFKNQARLIRTELDSRALYHIKVGTIHTFQGNECDKIIVSSAITDRTSRGAFDWMKNNHELINVMTTRPRKNLVVIADVDRVRDLSNGDISDYSELLAYITLKGETEVAVNENPKVKDYKHYNTDAERDFLQTIIHYRSTNQKFKILTKVKITDILKVDKSDGALFSYGNQAHFDFVLTDNMERPLLVIEVMGIEHFRDDKVILRDQMKRKICEKHNIELIEIKNNYVRRYNQIRDAIIKTLQM